MHLQFTDDSFTKLTISDPNDDKIDANNELWWFKSKNPPVMNADANTLLMYTVCNSCITWPRFNWSKSVLDRSKLGEIQQISWVKKE